jgi:gliding motility-associated-like protein
MNATEEYGIHQFDLSNYIDTAVLTSGTQITPIVPGEAGALQLAIDGKIYVAQLYENSLSVINNPNLNGMASDFVYNAIPLSGGISRYGLPPFIQSFFVIGLRARNFCLGDTTEFEVSSSDPILNIDWDFGDGNTSTLETPIHTYATAGTYPVSVTVTTASETKTESKDITIFETPIVNLATNVEVCHNQDDFTFDVTTKDTEILGTQSPADFEVQYYPSVLDRDNNSNEFTPTIDFPLGTSTLFAKVVNIYNTACFATTQFNILIKRTPDVLAVPDTTVCDDDGDGLYIFDLSTWDVLITPVMTNVNVGYYATQADADAHVNVLPTTYTNTDAVETIYFRIENAIYPECYEIGSFQLEVIDQVIANTPTDLEYCDDNNNGEAFFDLTQAAAEIIGTQNPASLLISYHDSQTDADANSNALNGINYFSSAYQNTIYVRVTNAVNSFCYDTTSFDVNIFDTPIVPLVTDWWVCDDDNDGLYLFDLTQKEAEILNGVNTTKVSFYLSQTDAELSQGPILGNHENNGNPQTIHFRLENTGNTNCYVLGSFQLQVFDVPTAHTPMDITVCDEDETGRYFFDLSQKDGEVLNGQDPIFYDVSYYGTASDAQNNLAPLAKADYQNAALNETIWVRVQHAELESCFDVSSFSLIVNPLPQLNVAQQYVICPDSPALVIDGGNFESWSWQDSNGTEISTARSFDVVDLGEYRLTVTQTMNGISCGNTAGFEVLSSGAPESITVETNGFSDQINVIVIATGTGPFEYSVDGDNYQISNEFVVFPGKYVVYVRDLLECRILSDEIIAIGYQRFFTPNGDGTNEYWNIIGAELYPASQLLIYDRYGKFIAQLSPNSRGWDGRYNGIPLPASDYWFKYTYDNDQVIRGHFSLKR